MSLDEINRQFSAAFTYAAGSEPSHYMSLIRFMTVVITLLSVGFAIVHFMDSEAKSSDSFIWILSSRLFRLITGMILIMVFLNI